MDNWLLLSMITLCCKYSPFFFFFFFLAPYWHPYIDIFSEILRIAKKMSGPNKAYWRANTWFSCSRMLFQCLHTGDTLILWGCCLHTPRGGLDFPPFSLLPCPISDNAREITAESCKYTTAVNHLSNFSFYHFVELNAATWLESGWKFLNPLQRYPYCHFRSTACLSHCSLCAGGRGGRGGRGRGGYGDDRRFDDRRYDDRRYNDDRRGFGGDRRGSANKVWSF